MIRIEHRPLPDGLGAIARRGAHGALTIIVSDSLEPWRQRAAVRTALRAARRHDWQLGLLPLPAVLFLAAGRSVLGKLGHLVRIHAAASAVAATSVAVVAATALVYVIPHAHGPAHVSGAGAPGSQPAVTSPQSPGHSSTGARPGRRPHARATSPGVVTAASPGPSSRPAPTSSASARPSPQPSPSTASSPPAGPTPTPTPSTSTAPPTSPSPSPSPTQKPPGTCVRILGIVVCL